jgi:sulfur transfer protein SufE
MMITIGSGLAGLLMPSPSGSAAHNLLNGDIEEFFDAIAYNYAGINTKSNSNSFGSMLKRAKGTWAAVAGRILKSVYQSF